MIVGSPRYEDRRLKERPSTDTYLVSITCASETVVTTVDVFYYSRQGPSPFSFPLSKPTLNQLFLVAG